MYYTGLDPFTGGEVHVARGLRDRKMQRALMQFFKPENYFMVREALLKARRGDLIGNGCDCLIPSQPPKAALRHAWRKRTSLWVRGSTSTRSRTQNRRGTGPAASRHVVSRGRE